MEICLDICPWTLSVPQSLLLGTDNVDREICEHISMPNGGYCLYKIIPVKNPSNLNSSYFQRQ